MSKVEITKTIIEEISSAVAKKLEAERKRKYKEDRDWKLRNTKLLLKNYHILKDHCRKISTEIDDYADSVFDPEDLELHSIMASKAKTRQMVWYIDEMLLAYERYANQAGEAAQRRFRTIREYHIGRKTYEDIARATAVSERTVRRDLVDARREFSVFLFGIFAIEDLNDQE